MVYLLIFLTMYFHCRVEMGPRKGCAKVQMKGIFVGAKVVRGPDWDWSNQDGGEGK
jgi:E3 ubiquitin-protein ligase mind-bomb